MPSTGNPRAVARRVWPRAALLWAVGAFAAGRLLAQAPAPQDGPSPSSPARLVEKLGAEEFDQRKAAAEELTRLGLAAQAALTAGLSHEDVQVRRSCRMLLADVLDDAFEKSLAEFEADSESDRGYGLPGWADFQAQCGHAAASRKLFAAMQRAEPGLMAALEIDAGEVAATFELRFSQISAEVFGSRGMASLSIGTAAALLLIAGDERYELASDSLRSAAWSNIVRQSEFQEALVSGPLQDQTRRLLGRWIARPTDPALLQQKLLLALQYELPEGLVLANRSLEDEKLHGYYRVYAVHAVGKIGKAAHAKRLAALLDDEAVCGQRLQAGAKADDPTAIQIRDVALAWLVHLTGQKHADYQFPQAAEVFAQLERSAYVQTQNLGFDNGRQRKAAFDRWRAYVEKNPLPEPPKLKEDNTAAGGERAPGDGSGNARKANPQAPGVARPILLLPGVRANGAGDDPQAAAGGLLPASRELVRKLAQAEEAMAAAELAQATQTIADILAEPEDYLFRPDQGGAVVRSVKAAAEGLLLRMPPAGWSAYELQCGPQAKALLEQALAAGDDRLLAELVSRFRFTRAAAEASFLLADNQLSRGRPFLAALLFARLLAQSPHARSLEPGLSLRMAVAWRLAGDADQSRAAIERLNSAGGRRTMSVGGGAVALGEDVGDRLAKILRLPYPPAPSPGWMLFRGDAARNAIAPPGGPFLEPDFVFPLSQDVRIAELLSRAAADRLREAQPSLPAGQPLVVGDRLLVRAVDGLAALDLSSGQPLWRAENDDILRHLSRQADSRFEEHLELLERGLAARVWNDPSFGQISSDGRLAYVVEGAPYGLSGDYQRLVVDDSGRRTLDRTGSQSHNRLAAYDVASGKLRWQIGGPGEAAPSTGDAGDSGIESAASDPAAQDEGGEWFLSAPLPWAGRLYVVGRRDDGLRLRELSAHNGASISSTYLCRADAEAPEPDNPLAAALAAPGDRRRGAAAPAVEAGILVCPLSDQSYAAVDLTSRRLLWLYRSGTEQRAEDETPAALLRRQLEAAETAAGANKERWLDHGPTVAEGKVLLSPSGEDRLICLNLADGRVDWTAARGDGLFVAGVVNGRAIVVGRGGLTGRALADGAPVWKTGAGRFPAGALPVGRGYATSEHYHIGLSTGEVAAFDLASGELVARSRSPGEEAPGNLVRQGDWVLSQTADSVSRFDTLSERRRRAMSPSSDLSPEEAAVRDIELARALLYDGRLAAAIEQLRTIRASRPSPETDALVVDAVLQTLKQDFDAGEPLAEEFASLLAASDQRAELWMTLAAGYQQRGAVIPAAENLLKLLDDPADWRRIEHVASRGQARRDRWVLARLGAMHRQTDSPKRRNIEEIVGRRFPSGWPEEAGSFAWDFTTSEQQLAAAEALARQGDMLRAEPRLLSLAAREPGMGPLATASLAEAFRRAGQSFDAAGYYRRLMETFAQQVCRDGKTGGELAAALPEGDPVRRRLDAWSPWPTTASTSKRATPRSAGAFRLPIPVTATSELVDRVWLEIDISGRFVYAKDRHGVELWRLPLPPAQNAVVRGRGLHAGSALQVGRVVVFTFDSAILAVDMGALDNQPPAPEMEDNSGGGYGSEVPQARLLWVKRGEAADDQANGRRAASLAQRGAEAPPVTLTYAAGAVIFQLDRAVLAVTPHSGELLWRLADIAPGSDLLAEDDVLLITPPGGAESLAVSTLDGGEIGRRPAPAEEGRVAALGRRVVYWRPTQQGVELSLFDPWLGAEVWKQLYPLRSRMSLVENDEAAVLTPEGRFVVVRLANGEKSLETGFEPIQDCQSIIVLRDRRQYILGVHQQANDAPFVGFFPGAGDQPINGFLAGIDPGSGKRLWSTRVEQQVLKGNQPSELPVLAMVSRKPVQKNGRVVTQSHVLALDRRRGKVLYDDRPDTPANLFDIGVRPDDKLVELRLSGEAVEIRFREPSPEQAK